MSLFKKRQNCKEICCVSMTTSSLNSDAKFSSVVILFRENNERGRKKVRRKERNKLIISRISDGNG